LPTFSFSFIVNAPLEVVAAFHQDTQVLKQLSPFPIIAQIHEYEPLADESEAKFTLWFGPVPVRWHAVHSDVGLNGFTDTQVSGPLKYWRHVHRFNVVDEDTTRVEEHITFEHDGGLRGLFSRLLFNKPGLYALFTARKIITRRAVARSVAVQKADKPR
jgi:ligand-binding SRPBCC domain-containing protein